jgi:hypothetical protein
MSLSENSGTPVLQERRPVPEQDYIPLDELEELSMKNLVKVLWEKTRVHPHFILALAINRHQRGKHTKEDEFVIRYLHTNCSHDDAVRRFLAIKDAAHPSV